MSTQITIKRKNGTIMVKTPYHPDYAAGAARGDCSAAKYFFASA